MHEQFPEDRPRSTSGRDSDLSSSGLEFRQPKLVGAPCRYGCIKGGQRR